MASQTRNHYVYIVKCADSTLYTGYALDPVSRARIHNAGRGAKYTRARRPVELVYTESYPSQGAALRREQEIKGKTRGQKLVLIGENS